MTDPLTRLRNEIETAERANQKTSSETWPAALDQPPERAGRTDDTQPMPIGNTNPHIHDLICADLQTRKQLGVRRYGTPLQTNNQRDALQDLYEELLDAVAYLRQLMEERDTS